MFPRAHDRPCLSVCPCADVFPASRPADSAISPFPRPPTPCPSSRRDALNNAMIKLERMQAPRKRKVPRRRRRRRSSMHFRFGTYLLDNMTPRNSSLLIVEDTKNTDLTATQQNFVILNAGMYLNNFFFSGKAVGEIFSFHSTILLDMAKISTE